MKGIDTIIWDWNGTLLNDISICIESMNRLLIERKLPVLDENRYKEVFGFPVKDYYANIGFDFEQEPFEIPAVQFIDIYSELLVDCPLHKEVNEVLNQFKNQGFRQVVLSAMEQEKLLESISERGIASHFEKIAGLDNDYATSKVDIGFEIINELGLLPSNCCLIGDTLHDAEVANALGCECILISNGHQSKSRLKQSGIKVYDSLSELINEVRKN